MIAQNDTFENSNYITYYKTERNVTLQSLKGIRPAERLPNVKKTHWAHNLISFNQVKTFLKFNFQALLLLCFDFAKLSFRKKVKINH